MVPERISILQCMRVSEVLRMLWAVSTEISVLLNLLTIVNSPTERDAMEHAILLHDVCETAIVGLALVPRGYPRY